MGAYAVIARIRKDGQRLVADFAERSAEHLLPTAQRRSEYLTPETDSKHGNSAFGGVRDQVVLASNEIHRLVGSMGAARQEYPVIASQARWKFATKRPVQIDLEAPIPKSLVQPRNGMETRSIAEIEQVCRHLEPLANPWACRTPGIRTQLIPILPNHREPPQRLPALAGPTRRFEVIGTMQIDLNADLGEGFGPWRMGDDEAMLDIVTSANVACGFHAGDPETMRRTAEIALRKGVALGAHPGYPDLIGFGRRPLHAPRPREIENWIAYQVGAFQSMCALAGAVAAYVKTHGALGNACADDDTLAMAVARGIRAADPALAFLVMPGTATERAAERAGLRPVREVYADRTYADTFNLTPRSEPGSVIHDPDTACRRVLGMLAERELVAESGRSLAVEIDSICVHGDNPAAVDMARALKTGLEAAGWSLAPFSSMPSP